MSPASIPARRWLSPRQPLATRPLIGQLRSTPSLASIFVWGKAFAFSGASALPPYLQRAAGGAAVPPHSPAIFVWGTGDSSRGRGQRNPHGPMEKRCGAWGSPGPPHPTPQPPPRRAPFPWQRPVWAWRGLSSRRGVVAR